MSNFIDLNVAGIIISVICCVHHGTATCSQTIWAPFSVSNSAIRKSVIEAICLLADLATPTLRLRPRPRPPLSASQAGCIRAKCSLALETKNSRFESCIKESRPHKLDHDPCPLLPLLIRLSLTISSFIP